MPKLEIPDDLSPDEFLEPPKNPGWDDGLCALCEKAGLTEDARCYGCGYLVCEDHCGDPWGKHYVIQHDEDEEE